MPVSRLPAACAAAVLLYAAAAPAAPKARFFKAEPGFRRTSEMPEDFRARVDSLIIDVMDAFEGSDTHSKYERWAFGVGNRIHIETRPGAVHKRLLFAPGDTVTRLTLLETEKALRGEEFLADAVLEVGPDQGGSRTVKVTVYDQWTTVLGGSVQVLDFRAADVFLGRWDKLADNEWLWWAGAWESNFLGTGTKLGGAVRHDLQRDTREARLSNSSATPWDLQAGLYGAWLSDGHSGQVKVAKSFKSLEDRHGFATAFSSLQLSEYHYFDANRLDELPEALSDSLAGRAHVQREYRRVTTDSLLLSYSRAFGRSLKVYAGPTFLWQDRYQKGSNAPEEGEVGALPIHPTALAPELRTDALLGFSLGLARYDYATVRNFRNLKWNESVETGWRLTARAAMNQEWLGASDSRLWFSQELVAAESWRDRFYAGCSLSTGWFFDPSAGGSEDGRVDVAAEAQWRQHPLTSSVLLLSWSHLFDSPRSRQLLLGASEGLASYPSFYFSGQARFLAQAEQRLFPDFEILTFVAAMSAFVAAGNTFPSVADFTPSDLHYSVGLGARLGRTKSTSKGVQHINIGFPVGDEYLSGPTVSILARRSL